MKSFLKTTEPALATQKPLGFTLIETLVSLAIVVLMTGLFLANYHSTNEKSTLNAAAEQLVSNIELAQSFGQAAKKNNGVSPVGGWGIYFATTSPAQYIIFADDNPLNDHKYSNDTIYQTVKLPANIKIDTTSGLSANNFLSNQLSLVFSPPEPITYIDRYSGSDDLTHGQSVIKLVDSSGRSKTIFVNFFGLVQVLN